MDLDFAVLGVEIARNAAAPALLFKLRAVNRTPDIAIEHVALTAQLRIEAAHRDYAAGERERLSELFGCATDWDRSLRGLMWTTVTVPIPRFADECTVNLPVPCSCDFEIAATKFLHGIKHGEIPLLLLFSGAIFFRNADGDLQIGQIAHHKEADFRLPVQLWHSLMRQYYPDKVWLRIDRDLFEEVYRYKRSNGFSNFDQALRGLLAASATEAAS
jgi:hypothetical protein